MVRAFDEGRACTGDLQLAGQSAATGSRGDQVGASVRDRRGVMPEPHGFSSSDPASRAAGDVVIRPVWQVADQHGQMNHRAQHRRGDR